MQAGELEPMRKAIFLRQLSVLMAVDYCLKKSHNVQRSGRHVRGFKGVGVRMDAGSSAE